MCKVKIFPGVIYPRTPLKGKWRGRKERDEGVEEGKGSGRGKEREGMGRKGREGERVGRGGKGREVQREERRGRERRGGNERRKVGWGNIASCSQGG
jgi:hypothetical protein